MSSAYIIANTVMALIDLGIAFAVYRIYRWVSTPTAGLADNLTIESLLATERTALDPVA